jgi:tetratricopeptide (TPR) repeat protein
MITHDFNAVGSAGFSRKPGMSQRDHRLRTAASRGMTSVSHTLESHPNVERFANTAHSTRLSIDLTGSLADRARAAEFLREARRCLALDLDASDACHWALILLPTSGATQRAMIDCLQRCGALDDAAALVSAGLLQRGERDWKLWLRRARILLAQRRLSDAHHAIERAIALQPRRFGPLLLAADIARAMDDHELALHRLERAGALRPRHAHLAPRMIDSLLALDRADDAAAVMEQVDDPPADLAARVLTAQRRLCDARQALESARSHEHAGDLRHSRVLQGQLIEVLERMGDWPALRAMAAERATRANALTDDPVLATRLASALLSMGECATAASLCQKAGARAGDRAHCADALATLAVASAVLGDHAAAAAHLADFRAARQTADHASEARAWLRGLLGVIVAEQCDVRAARRAGADPAASVLQPLLHRVLAAFDRGLAAEADSPQARRWHTLRQRCERALRAETDAIPRELDLQSLHASAASAPQAVLGVAA